MAIMKDRSGRKRRNVIYFWQKIKKHLMSKNFCSMSHVLPSGEVRAKQNENKNTAAMVIEKVR